MSSGWIKLHRQIQENPLWYCEKFTWGQAWVDMLLLANHDTNIFKIRGNTITVHRGFIGCSEDTLAQKWKWSRGKVRRFLKHLETIQQIVQHKSTVLSLVEIVNYNSYQSNDTQNSTTDGTTERQQTVQQTDTNKNDKNVKNENNLPQKRIKTLNPSFYPAAIFCIALSEMGSPAFDNYEQMQSNMGRWAKVGKEQFSGYQPSQIVNAFFAACNMAKTTGSKVTLESVAKRLLGDKDTETKKQAGIMLKKKILERFENEKETIFTRSSSLITHVRE